MEGQQRDFKRAVILSEISVIARSLPTVYLGLLCVNPIIWINAGLKGRRRDQTRSDFIEGVVS